MARFWLIYGAAWAVVITSLFWPSPAVGQMPGQKWGLQLELGTVGNSVVYKVQDDALTCLVWQPKNGGTPAINCWGAP